MRLLPSLSHTLVFLLCMLMATVLGAETSTESTEALSTAEAQADFDELYQVLKASHFDLFINTPEAEYQALYEQYRNQLDRPHSRAELADVFQRFVAKSGIAHARIEGQNQAFGDHLAK